MNIRFLCFFALLSNCMFAQDSEIKDPPTAPGLLEKVTLEYRSAPLVDVLKTIGETAKINIVISPAVSDMNAVVTMRLVDVTYDLALKTLLKVYQLGSVAEDGLLRIDTLRNFQATQKSSIDIRTQNWSNEPTRVLIYQVNYAKAEDIRGILDKSLSVYTKDPRFNIQVDKRSNKVIVEGIAEVLSKVKSLLTALDKAKQQVQIEARIVEASTELAKTLSITWGSKFALDGTRGFGSKAPFFPNFLFGNIGGAGSLGGVAPGIGTGVGPTQLGSTAFSLGSANGSINLDGILRAYETESMAQIIASPRIVCQDNENCTISDSATSSRPVLRGDRIGEQSTNTLVSLDVKPQITNDNTIELDVSVDRASPTNAPSDPVQGTSTRKAKTKLLVRNGDTAVIGGLYQTLKFRGQGRIPFLGKLPIIGFLFRTNDEASFKSELMVFITPRILAMSTANLADSETPPNTAQDNIVENNFNANAEPTNLSPANNTAKSNVNAGAGAGNNTPVNNFSLNIPSNTAAPEPNSNNLQLNNVPVNNNGAPLNNAKPKSGSNLSNIPEPKLGTPNSVNDIPFNE